MIKCRPGRLGLRAQGGQHAAQQQPAADPGQEQARVRQHVPPDRPADADDVLALGLVQHPGNGAGQHVRGAARVEQLVRLDRADAEGRHRMVVPGHRQHGARGAETTPSCLQAPGARAGRSPGRIRADSPAAASASGHTWPVP